MFTLTGIPPLSLSFTPSTNTCRSTHSFPFFPAQTQRFSPPCRNLFRRSGKSQLACICQGVFFEKNGIPSHFGKRGHLLRYSRIPPRNLYQRNLTSIRHLLQNFVAEPLPIDQLKIVKAQKKSPQWGDFHAFEKITSQIVFFFGLIDAYCTPKKKSVKFRYASFFTSIARAISGFAFPFDRFIT